MPASLELVKIALQAYANGDSEIALALAGPQVRWDERASRAEGDLVWGQENVARAMRRYLDGWAEYRFDVEEIAEVGPGRIVGICRERGRPKEGPAVDRRFGGLWIVEDGKITSWTTYLTPREAVRAAKELGPVEVAAAPAQPAPAVPEPAAAVPEPPPPPPASEPEVVAERAAPAPAAEPEPTPEPQAEEVWLKPFDFEAVEDEAPEPVAAAPEEPPKPEEAAAPKRPRKRMLTKSEEQKRAARARAKLRQQSSRESA
jgi:ketosteroid isomerase-like protein